MKVFVIVFENPYFFDEEANSNGYGGGVGFYKAESKEDLFLKLKDAFLSKTCNKDLNGNYYGFMNMDMFRFGHGYYRRAYDLLKNHKVNPTNLTVKDFHIEIYDLQEYGLKVAKDSF